MTEANKNTFKDLAKIFGGFGIFTAIAIYVPDYSNFKHIFAILCAVFLGLAILYYTPLGNPIKRLYRKITGKKEGE